ncbi:indole-3-glycerol phosphate synthase TrpC [Falsibacillus albus]|uniref:Indole-3-glycerol phosphate synthase n=1 Tax=Falsibacillus albus TaxID=2478915 RepID=A0A3L7JXX0_9BACI|nr:indole-3-glycerol phosphate synthase TrpC [Falsibacillus albus]RLQ95370.1 indole-3-glycerol phosphate synthase TrpC [Falsibacillus albus]
MTILDVILEEKKNEVARLKTNGTSLKPVIREKVSLYDRFMKSDKMNVISEIKRASPSKGDINIGVDPVLQAKQYEAAGADAISILTDRPYFKGSMEDLRNVREHVSVPILCKDFIIDPIQIEAAEANGADVILLIAAALEQDQLIHLYEEARRRNLEVLLEVHDEQELERALEIGANIIGINNRDLKSFTVDLGNTKRLASKIRNEEILVISESGFKTGADAEEVKSSRVKGILVGETLMKAEDISSTLASLKVQL